MASYVETILAAATTVGLRAGLGNIPVIQRLTPKIFEGDPLPIVIVNHKQTQGWRLLTFAGHKEQIHTVQATLIAADNEDYVNKKGQFEQWQQLLRDALFGVADELDGAPDVCQVELLDDDAFDASVLTAIGYFYWFATIRYSLIPQTQ